VTPAASACVFEAAPLVLKRDGSGNGASAGTCITVHRCFGALSGVTGTAPARWSAVTVSSLTSARGDTSVLSSQWSGETGVS
jgi:hypothetical protein